MLNISKVLLIIFTLPFIYNANADNVMPNDLKSYCISMQHENTLFAGQGYCVYKFLFNSCYGYELRNIKISFSTITDMEHTAIRHSIEMDSIGASRAEQYKEEKIELPCDISSMQIESAKAMINGKEINLITSDILRIDNSFKPIEIFFKK